MRTRLAWALGSAIVAVVTVAAAFDVANRGSGHGQPWLPAIVAVAVGFAAVGVLIATRRPNNVIGWLLLAVAAGSALSGAGLGYGTWAATRPEPAAGAAFGLWLGQWTWTTVVLLPVAFLLFPNGSLPHGSLRKVCFAALAVGAAVMLGTAIDPRQMLEEPRVDNPVGIQAAGPFLDAASDLASLAVLMLFITSLVALAGRARHSDGDERRQLGWLLVGSAALSAQLPFEALAPDRVAAMTTVLFVAVFCIAFGVAMLRHRLYEIDVILNRAVVFGVLTAGLGAAYAAAIVLSGGSVQGRWGPAVSLTLAAAAAVALAPLRSRLERWVDRLLYGERHDPYSAMDVLGRRLDEAVGDQLLPSLAEEVARTLRLAGVTIRTADGEVAAYGHSDGDPEVYPLGFRGRHVGSLELTSSGRETFSPQERRTLGGLARQLGVAVYAIALTSDLQRAREKLVTGREEERRRLRRDLHDGLGPLLAGVGMQVAAAQAVLPSDAGRAEAILRRLLEQTQDAILSVRRLVEDLRPPALDELGLASAIREQAARFDGCLDVTVEVSGDLTRLPAAAEVAAFRIATEAITNAARHARARTCQVRLCVDHDLDVEVRDDGIGIPAHPPLGVGLVSMRERSAELGGNCSVRALVDGGTVVSTHIPLSPAV